MDQKSHKVLLAPSRNVDKAGAKLDQSRENSVLSLLESARGEDIVLCILVCFIVVFYRIVVRFLSSK